VFVRGRGDTERRFKYVLGVCKCVGVDIYEVGVLAELPADKAGES
jgi:hypothetical protein